LASDVIAFLNYLKIARTSVVGWSDGAIVGLEIAIHYPERLDRLVAFAANYTPLGLRDDARTNSTMKEYFERVRQDYKRLSATPERFNDFLGAMRQMWKTQPNFSERGTVFHKDAYSSIGW